MNKKPLIVANWKMFIESPEAAKEFASALKRRAKSFGNVEVGVAAPTPFISTVATVLKGSKIQVGAQTVSAFDFAQGKQHTGEVSGTMLKNAGASFALVGHSERRTLGESDEMVRIQLEHAIKAGLVPILCVGERERDAGGAHFSFIEGQILSALKNSARTAGKLIVAYEPVWAIGKSAADAMPPSQVREMAIFIRKILADVLGRKSGMRVPILYGGSVEGENARALLAEGSIAGFLVGHASASTESFVEILKSVR